MTGCFASHMVVWQCVTQLTQHISIRFLESKSTVASLLLKSFVLESRGDLYTANFAFHKWHWDVFNALKQLNVNVRSRVINIKNREAVDGHCRGNISLFSLLEFVGPPAVIGSSEELGNVPVGLMLSFPVCLSSVTFTCGTNLSASLGLHLKKFLSWLQTCYSSSYPFPVSYECDIWGFVPFLDLGFLNIQLIQQLYREHT